MNPLRWPLMRELLQREPRIPLVEPIQPDPFRRWDRMARNDVSSCEDAR